MNKTIEKLIHTFKVDVVYNQYAFDNDRRSKAFFNKYEEEKEARVLKDLQTVFETQRQKDIKSISFHAGIPVEVLQGYLNAKEIE